jgi:uncharacterized protein DUF6626
MNELDNVYATLKRLKLCKSGYQFSREYLGRAPNYYSVVKANGNKPSLAAMTTLYYSLIKQLALLEGSNNIIIINAKQELDNVKRELACNIQERCLNSTS